jgi:hypothetical protein
MKQALTPIFSLLILICFSWINTPLHAYVPTRYVVSNHSKKLSISTLTHLNTGVHNSWESVPDKKVIIYPSYSFGFLIAKKINKRQFIETGLIHHSGGYKYSRLPLITNTLELMGDKIITHERFDMIGLPMKFMVYSSPNKLRYLARLGVGANFLYRNTATNSLYAEGFQITTEVLEKSIKDYQTFTPSLYAGLGFEYDIEQHFGLRVEPFAQFFFIGGERTARITQIGVSLTAQYLFN